MTENEAIILLRIHKSTLEKGGYIGGKDAALEYNIAIKALEEIQQYRAIGTVEECRKARERQIPKKPRFYAHNYYCGNCGNLVGNSEFNWKRFRYCDHCGSAVDWSE